MLQCEMIIMHLHAASMYFTDAVSGPIASASFFHSLRMEDELRSKVAKAAHKAIHHTCDLYWSVLDDSPTHHRDANTSQITSSTTTFPDTVHARYGEMTYPPLDSLLLWLCRVAPSSVRLTSHSYFLDLGSGFAKCVIHARLRAQVRRSVGIEYVPLRHSKAYDALHHLRDGKAPGFADKQYLLLRLP